ncbi:MAG: peptidoglycan DD-metalloendopeptidase family protein [Patescibacteria group bacterium]|nr:peptidoglycan DD-metalloendopeptidase family protein [Patescibacteria group bacterium]
MKFNKDTKTKIKAILVIILSLVLNFSRVSAETADNAVDSLNLQKQERQKKLDALNKQIKDYTQQIATAQSSANTLKNQITIYDKQITATQLQIEAKQTQIEDTSLQISELEKLIDQKTKDIAENRKILAELIVQLNEFDNSYVLKTTLASGNLSDFLDQVQYTQNFQDKIYQLVQKIKDLKAKLESDEQDLKVQLANLQDLKEELEISQESLTAQRDQKQTLLTQTRGLESNYQRLLASSKNEELSLQKEIDDLDAKIRAKLGNKVIESSKGALAWPMDGVLTQGYGNTGFTALGYTFHNGIDVAAPAGQPIYAAADGIVLDTDHSDTSYGNWAAVKHSIPTQKSGTINIVTLYAHMRTIKVSPGQFVKAGDLIGYEGNTGNTTKKLYGPSRGYHIHFGVYDAEGFGINPGAYQKIYGPYKVPYGYTYNPMSFLQ